MTEYLVAHMAATGISVPDINLMVFTTVLLSEMVWSVGHADVNYPVFFLFVLITGGVWVGGMRLIRSGGARKLVGTALIVAAVTCTFYLLFIGYMIYALGG